MYKKSKFIRKLEEQYEEEKREIQKELEYAEEQLKAFHAETEEVFDKVRYLTSKEPLDIETLNWQLMEIDDAVYQEGERYYAHLEEQQHELRRKFERALEQAEEEERRAARDKDKQD